MVHIIQMILDQNAYECYPSLLQFVKWNSCSTKRFFEQMLTKGGVGLLVVQKKMKKNYGKSIEKRFKLVSSSDSYENKRIVLIVVERKEKKKRKKERKKEERSF
ncbi:hypothetical protein LOAG_13157, partial [Loa loa]